MSGASLSLVVYDTTDVRGKSAEHGGDGTARGPIALTPWWRAGGLLHRLVRRARGEPIEVAGHARWEQALRWAVETSVARGVRIRELQVWGHGGWGFMDLGKTRLDRAALARSSPLAPDLDALRDRLEPDALLWLRCCSAFGAHEGRRFGPALAERMRTRVAGHTYVIHALQSGTHALAPGESVDWPLEEGVVMRDSEPLRAKDSMPFEPRTIGCLRLELPTGW